MVNLVVSPRGRALRDPRVVYPDASRGVVGLRDPPVLKTVLALPPWQSGLTRRYASHAPGDSCLYGMDFSPIIPKGAEIVSASLLIFVNTDPAAASTDFVVGPVAIASRTAVQARLSGGVDGNDSQLRWTVVDSDGNTWTRTALLLSSLTS